MASKKPSITISPMQMIAWSRMESEHTASKKAQEKIVKEHVQEHGKGYYPALKKMESKLPKK